MEYQKIMELFRSPDPQNILLGLTVAQSLQWNGLLDGLRLLTQNDLSAQNIQRLTKYYRIFSLAYRGLEQLPQGLSLLTKISGLFLYNNRLKTLTEDIVFLSDIQQLHLQSNCFSVFPTQICQLRHLRYLYIHNNQLQALPAEIGQCSQLEVLALNANQLQTLPMELVQLRQLKKVFLQNNPLNISQIPPTLLDPDICPPALFAALSPYLT